MRYFVTISHGQIPGPGAEKGRFTATLYGEEANALDSASVEFSTHMNGDGLIEYSAEEYEAAVFGSIRTLLEKTKVNPEDIWALSSTGHYDNFVLLDADGKEVCPGVKHGAYRFQEEDADILRAVSETDLIRFTGSGLIHDSHAAILLWHRKHHPLAFDRIKYFLTPKDLVTFLLTGRYVTDYADASCSMLLDIPNRIWSKEMLSALGLPPSLLPELCESGAFVGTVTPAAAAKCGLSTKTRVLPGCSNKSGVEMTSAIYDSGDGAFTIAASGNLILHTAKPMIDPEGRLALYCSSFPEEYFVMLNTAAATASFNWFGTTFLPDFEPPKGKTGRPYAGMEALAAQSRPGANGVLFLPYLRGEETPWFDKKARGTFFGISAKTTKADLARAVIEGFAFSVRDVYQYAKRFGLPVNNIHYRLPGDIPFILEVLANVTGVTTKVPALRSPGLAMVFLMYVDAGMFPDVKAAARHFMGSKNVIEPDPKQTAIYDSLYTVYRELYPALKSSFASLSLMR